MYGPGVFFDREVLRALFINKLTYHSAASRRDNQEVNPNEGPNA